MLIAVGFIGLITAIVLLVKKYEARMVLFMVGIVLTLIAMNPVAGFKAYTAAIKGSNIIEIIVSSMGFAMVLEYTKCDKHLVHFLAKGLKKFGPALIPGAVAVTAFVHISIPSAAGCTAAVGSVLIPILIGSGVHPAMAASTVFAGTYGASHLHPGFHQNVVISEAAKHTPIEVVSNHFVVVLILGAVVAAGMTLTAYLRKEHKGYHSELEGEEFEVNYLKAFVPLFPLVLIILGTMNIVPQLKVLAISHSMLIGVIFACLVTRTNPGHIAEAFFKGMGSAFGHIYGIIICSTVFVAGLTATGLLKMLLDGMSAHPDFAKISASFGPFLLAVICGSGDAASVAFNGAVTPSAAQFGIEPLNLGSVAAIGAAVGRSMSPIAGAALVACGLAGVKDPMDIAKRNGPVMLVTTLVMSALLLYMR